MSSNYSARDFDTISAALIQYIRDDPVLAQVWTDYTDGQIGIILLDLIAYTGDILENSMDFRVADLYLATATLRESVYRIAKSLGYPIPGATSSAADVVLTFTGGPFGVALEVPELTLQVGGYAWRYGGGGILAVGDTTLLTTWTQGEKQSQTFQGDGTSYQRFQVGTVLLAAGSVVVKVDDVAWAKEDQIGLAAYDDQSYELFIDEAGTWWVQTGNSYNGRRPSSDNVVTIEYVVTDGAGGNVGAAVFDAQVISWFAAELGTTVVATLANASPSAVAQGAIAPAGTFSAKPGMSAREAT